MENKIPGSDILVHDLVSYMSLLPKQIIEIMIID